MGQYFKPIILTKDGKIKGYFNSHEYGCGSKLMEHSYIGNSLCNAVENYINKKGGARLVWAGDYAQGENAKYSIEDVKPIWQEEVAKGNVTCSLEDFHKDKVWEKNLFELADDKKPITFDKTNDDYIRYIINVTKKEYVDLWTIPHLGENWAHPLPLLTAEGNGLGNGDYIGCSQLYVGSWARDYIMVLNNEEFSNRCEYIEIKPNFVRTYEVVNLIKEATKLLNEHDFEEVSEYLSNLGESLNNLKGVISKIKTDNK